MGITNRMEMFKKAHDKAMENINAMLNTDKDYEQDFKLLIRWLMETEVNPYAILPEGWAGCLNDAVSFNGLCAHIHHAMVDDGEIEFVTVNDEPRIVFVGSWEENFEDRVLSKQELNYKNNGIGGKVKKVNYEVKVIGKNVQEFIKSRLEYDIGSLRRSFEWDAADDLNHAIEHYSKNPLFDHNWIYDIENSKRYNQRKVLLSTKNNH
jgi:hypothetical protein